MKLLHTSDWHLGKSLYEFSLLEDQELILNRLLEILREEKIDALLIAGDIYDRPIPSAQAVRLFDSFLAEATLGLKVPVIAVAGNHDSGARLEFASGLMGQSGYHIAGKVRENIPVVTLHDKHGPVNIHLLPWLYPGDVRALLPESEIKNFDSAYKALLEQTLGALDANQRNVIIAHGFFAGLGGQCVLSESEVSVGGMDIADSSVFSRFTYAALGHLHAPQQAGAPHIRYSGSPLKYSLSEQDHCKSVTFVELGRPGEIEITQIPLPFQRDLRTVRGSFEQLMDPGWHENKSFGDYVFAEITGHGALYPMEKLRTLFPQLLGLRFEMAQGDGGASREVGAARERISVQEHFVRFYEAVKGEQIPDGYLRVLKESAAELEDEIQQGEDAE